MRSKACFSVKDWFDNKLCNCSYIVIALLITRISSVPAQTTTAFLKTFLMDYDNRIAPSFYEPTEVAVSVKIDTIDSVTEADMEFSTNILLTQQWVDQRLMFFNLIPSEYLELDTKMMTGVWVPDLYFSNEKMASFHTVTVPNKMMHIYKNGTVRYKARLSVTASCPMKLRKYPMDRQVCSLKLRSFAYSTKNVVLQWNANLPIVLSHMELPQFNLHSTHHYNCCEEITNCSKEFEEDEFSCIRADFILDRELGYFLIQLYIPSLLVVALSWVSFWLSVDAVPARISLGILTVLTMTTQRSSATSSLPRVSYIKAIDVWMASCLVFVIAALLEYAFTNVLMRRDKTDRPGYNHAPTKGPTTCQLCGADNDIQPENSNSISIQIAYTNHPDTIDRFARILFPLCFVIFCLLYWIIYVLVIEDDVLIPPDTESPSNDTEC